MTTTVEVPADPMDGGRRRPLGIKLLALSFWTLGTIPCVAFIWGLCDPTPEAGPEKDLFAPAVMCLQLLIGCWSLGLGIRNRSFKSLEPALTAMLFLGGLGLIFVGAALATLTQSAAGDSTRWHRGGLAFFTALLVVNAWGYFYLRRAEARGWFEYPIRKRSRRSQAKPVA